MSTDHDFDMPWFPFWASDFLGSRTVRLMSTEDVGIYILLLAHEWMDGPIPEDAGDLSVLTQGANATDVERVLERCFVRVEDGWVNERLETIREEQIDKRMQKVRAGKASARARRRSRKSNHSNKKERRSNGRSTGVPTEGQRSTNEPEPEPEPETTVPVSDLWSVWIEELGGDPPHARLTRKRKDKLEALHTEHLANTEEPIEVFRKLLRCVKKSDHHMSERAYQFPESLFRNEERRDRWVQVAFSKNGSSDPRKDTDWAAEIAREREERQRKAT